jgi:predicted transcriptional regulator
VDLFTVCASICSEQLDRLLARTTRTIVRGRTQSDNPNYHPTTFVSADHSAEIVTRYRSGDTIVGIARSLKIARCTVQFHLDKAGIERKATPRKLTSPQLTEARRMLDEGTTWKEVGLRFGVDAKTVRTGLAR